MDVNDFELIRRHLADRAGIDLPRDRAYLVKSRLAPVARKWSFGGLDDLAEAVRLRTDKALLADVVEALLIKETYFFRDSRPFLQFRDLVLPHLLQQNHKSCSLRIWCAGCSSGQEAYSLAMLLRDRERDLAGWEVQILGTDLSAEVLVRARDGIYNQLEVQRGLPITYLIRDFSQDDGRWRVSDALRQIVEFRPFNLLEDYSHLGRFDMVLCRNVLPHFGRELQKSVLERMTGRLNDEGFLVLGLDEPATSLSERLQPIPGLQGIYGLFEGAPAASRAAG